MIPAFDRTAKNNIGNTAEMNNLKDFYIIVIYDFIVDIEQRGSMFETN